MVLFGPSFSAALHYGGEVKSTGHEFQAREVSDMLE